MIEFILGCILLIAGGLFTAFPRDRRYITRLINIEVAEFGLVLIMLSFSEVLALVTFVAVKEEEDRTAAASVPVIACFLQFFKFIHCL